MIFQHLYLFPVLFLCTLMKYGVNGLPVNSAQLRNINHAFKNNLPSAKQYHQNMLDSYHIDYQVAKENKTLLGRLKAAGKIYATSGPIGSKVHTYGKAMMRTLSATKAS